jgi:hypothetical protein
MLVEHENEGDDEEFITLLIADMQNPITPVIDATLAGEGFDDARCMLLRLSKIVHYGAAIIDENLL